MLPDGAHLRDEDWTVFLLNQQPLPSTDYQPEDDFEQSKKKLPVDPIKPLGELLYCVNLCRTKHIAGVKRGARVKAMSICARHPYLHIYKPMLVLALEKYFLQPSLGLLESLYTSLNSCDVLTVPMLSNTEKAIVRGGNMSVLFPDDNGLGPMKSNTRVLGKKNPARSRISSTQSTISREVVGQDARLPFEPKLVCDGASRVTWEGRVDIDSMSVPIRIPVDAYSQELYDFSVTSLVETFHKPPSKSHEPSQVMIILHGILSQRRIVFLGHQTPAGEIAKYVLAASSLVAPYLRTVVDRLFPYTCLTLLDKLLSFPGFIAGVANPAFQSHDAWWDILCDIPSGKVILSPRLAAQSAYGWNTESSGPLFGDTDKDVKERELIAYDNEFMAIVADKCKTKPPDAAIRAMFSAYIKKFLDVACLYEYDRVNSPTFSSTPMTSIGSKNEGNSTTDNSIWWPHHDKVPGPRAVRVDPSIKAKEFAIFARRFNAWRGTATFEAYLDDWNTSLMKRLSQQYLQKGQVELSKTWPWTRKLLDSASLTASYWSPWVDDTDSHVLIQKLRESERLDVGDLNFIYESLLRNVADEECLQELMKMLPAGGDGVKPLCAGFFHHSAAVRAKATNLIQAIKVHKYGLNHVNRLNPFLLVTHQRLLNEVSKRTVTVEEPSIATVTTKIVLPSITTSSSNPSIAPTTHGKEKGNFPAAEAVHHLVDSTDTVASRNSLDSYMSFSHNSIAQFSARMDESAKPQQVITKSKNQKKQAIKINFGSEPSLNFSSNDNVSGKTQIKGMSNDSLVSSPKALKKATKKIQSPSGSKQRLAGYTVGSSHVQRGNNEPRQSLRELDRDSLAKESDADSSSLGVKAKVVD